MAVLMRVWDGREFPIAYLITFRTYGTWLHGDARGSFDRFNNTYGAPAVEDNIIREQQNVLRLKSPPFVLNSNARRVVEESIRAVCDHRRWLLHALNARTNHVHVVASVGDIKPDGPMRDFKAYSTRDLRREECWREQHSPWSEGGSRRYLWKEESLWNACNYVINGQGDDLPEF